MFALVAFQRLGAVLAVGLGVRRNGVPQTLVGGVASIDALGDGGTGTDELEGCCQLLSRAAVTTG